jgi:hypothetical protein
MSRSLSTSASLGRLSDADYEVAPSGYDVRSWRVLLATDEYAGTVDDVLVDTVAERARYLEVTLEPTLAGADGRVLVPLDNARLDLGNRFVILSGMTGAELSKMASGSSQDIHPNYDEEYRAHLSQAYPPRRRTWSASDLCVIRKRSFIPRGDGPASTGSVAKVMWRRGNWPMWLLVAAQLLVSVRLRRPHA